MARLPTSTSRTRAVTTYRSKNSPSFRNLGVNLKTTANKPTPKSNQQKVAVKKSNAAAAGDSYNDDESMESGDEGDDDGIDPNLKALVKECTAS